MIRSRVASIVLLLGRGGDQAYPLVGSHAACPFLGVRHAASPSRFCRRIRCSCLCSGPMNPSESRKQRIVYLSFLGAGEGGVEVLIL